jgi:hypothetical protein
MSAAINSAEVCAFALDGIRTIEHNNTTNPSRWIIEIPFPLLPRRPSLRQSQFKGGFRI